MARGSPTIKLRIDADLKGWLVASATENRRSLNGEIEFRLLQARASHESDSSRVKASPDAA